MNDPFKHEALLTTHKSAARLLGSLAALIRNCPVYWDAHGAALATLYALRAHNGDEDMTVTIFMTKEEKEACYRAQNDYPETA